MKRYLIIATSALLLAACKENKPAENAIAPKDTAAATTTPLLTDEDTSTVDADTAEEPTATYYVVMADTGENYYQLRDNMLRISKATGMPIDTMGRGYDEEKDLICLPKNDEDEVYAGEYYPRRFPSVNLSLEYLDTYKKEQVGETTMALVAGIFETRQSADSLLRVIKPVSRTPFVEMAQIYMECMH